MVIDSGTVTDEKHLIERSKSNPEEFRALYDAYFHQIFRFVFRRVGEIEDARDITQQVFLKALSGLKNYVHRGFPFSSFLYRIAVNECNQFFRDRTRIRYVTIDEQFHESPAEEMGLIEMDSGIDNTALVKALSVLSPDELFMVELRFFEKKHFKEIGTIFGITENLAKVRTYRLLDKIRRALKK